jgi:hypothetical protein
MLTEDGPVLQMAVEFKDRKEKIPPNLAIQGGLAGRVRTAVSE